MNCFERCTHLPIANNVRDHNDFSSRITGFKLNDRLNGDVVVAEAAANAADHAWCILCFETHVVSLAGLLLVARLQARPPAPALRGSRFPSAGVRWRMPAMLRISATTAEAVGPKPAPGT